MACSLVGGLSGSFIPVSEDANMIQAVQRGSLSLAKLEAMTAICSVGLDMIAIPGDTPAATITGLIADEAAIGVANGKTTAVRVIPVPGKGEATKLILEAYWVGHRLWRYPRFLPKSLLPGAGASPPRYILLRTNAT